VGDGVQADVVGFDDHARTWKETAIEVVMLPETVPASIGRQAPPEMRSAAARAYSPPSPLRHPARTPRSVGPGAHPCPRSRAHRCAAARPGTARLPGHSAVGDRFQVRFYVRFL
jgi:hypothetical protein